MKDKLRDAVNQRIISKINEAIQEMGAILDEKENKIEALESSLSAWREVARQLKEVNGEPEWKKPNPWQTEDCKFMNIGCEYWAKDMPKHRQA